ncbi:TonB-dependent receptor plug domain-containing protein [Brevundimonas sp. SL130]|uniref:TonB-dependent receptor plug domain-containing protein n=1 Tax=Brevundimonas sp. SL130 TaxID=2995143 RepID=UPI00226C725F|nr:TonB-dependent receptor [Brevundimonas sp. SL130]WAC60762.1 TonB-dependent receptor [Brevundimonas sp. SL130]
MAVCFADWRANLKKRGYKMKTKLYLMASAMAVGLPMLASHAFADDVVRDAGQAVPAREVGSQATAQSGVTPAAAAKSDAAEETPADGATQTRPVRAEAAEADEVADGHAVLSDLVVTGTRIKNKTTFDSPSSIQVITAEDMAMLGQTDIASVLQDSTVAANASQIDNNYTGYSVEGGTGVNTLSMRGLGALRTLILVNGHRVGPAGVQGQVGPVDLNTIPNTIIERAEILKDGASSLYGSDAVAGVVNIITKQRFNGGSVNITESVPVEAGGRRDSFSISQGFTHDRWFGSVGLDYSNQESLNLGDRDWSSCPNPYVYYADGTRADLVDAETGTYQCNMMTTGTIQTGGAVYVLDDTATLGGGATGLDRVGLHRVRYTFPSTVADYINKTRASRAEVPNYDSKYDGKNMISPSTKYSFVTTGGYDLDGGAQIYFDVLANQRESSTANWMQFWPTVNITNPNNIAKAGNSLGLTAASAYSVIAIPQLTDQKVRYNRGLIGIRGELPDFGSLRGWTWDIAAQISHSNGAYGQSFVYADRVAATTAAGTVCDVSKLTTATSCPTGGVQWFRPSTVTTGNFTAEESAFLFGYETGHTTYDQKYIEANFTGDLFTLPAGTVGAAFGLQFRQESLDDAPGAQAVAKNYWNTSTLGATKGDDTIKEVYGEISLPLVRDVFLVKSLDVDVSSRFSHYDSYGSSTTYKAGVNWAVTDTLRLRGSQGTSFRAPGLYERFLSQQTSLYTQTIDPCYRLLNGTISDPSANLVTNCAKVGLSSTYAGGASAVVTEGGNGDTLKAETALNRTAGIIFTPKSAPIMVSVDYYDTEINDQISSFGPANILNECYNSLNMSSAFCNLFTRATTNGNGYVAGNITAVDNSYQNVAEQRQKGFDVSFTYSTKVLDGMFTFTSDNTFVREWTWQLFTDSEKRDDLGLIGYPEYNGSLNFRYQRNDIALNWGVSMVGRASNYSSLGTDMTASYQGTGVAVRNIVAVPFYHNHSFSISKRMDRSTVVLSVRNVFDRDPPIISSAAGGRVGNGALTSQYDQLGRTIVLNLTREW